MLLSDGDRIRGLLGTYCRLIDAGDFAGVGALFARATLRDPSGTVIATGAAEAEALYAAITQRHQDGTPRTQHLVTNTTFDEGTGEDEAVARSSYVVLQGLPGGALQPIVAGSYVDTFARDAGGWHFTDRTFTVGLTGDLSRHLTIDPSGAPS
ncbi:MAG: nuclear transport factor 2 family protein [Nocardioidaceae bacterium]|nr:nuclear transport factor 2 family protein [Nocardioidaceae bacterium]